MACGGFAGSVSLGFSACLSTVSCVLLDAANQQLESLFDKPEIGEHWSPRDFLDFRGREFVISGSFLESVESYKEPANHLEELGGCN